LHKQIMLFFILQNLQLVILIFQILAFEKKILD